MSADRFAEVERIYHEAKRRLPAERSAFLDQACGSDDALQKEVESLLSLQTNADGFLSGSAIEQTARGSHRLWEASSWPTIPGYTVQRVLGEGGMGVVYIADQETPLRRLVALKLIKPGMDTRQVVARFETERQALALMDHPNIAAVFDAGATKDGRPYFVMEYVDGVCITEYCDRKRLSTRERLALFVQVCAAVQHAHQKGVIHRDLKPSNVLVTERDWHALPKVIDFGTAKAVGGAWNATATQDGQGMVLGTLEYMSPEQAALSADIDTATDVYSLGVLLYELLVGQLPFDTTELRAAGYDEIRRVIRESDPPKPSVRAEQRHQESGAAARARQTDVPGLTRQLRGDLDWITLKALEKDRKRRYATVAAFATDIGRFLGDQPVDARPPSSSYRIRKFTRRHRGAVAAAVSLFVVLVAGLVASRWQYLRAVDAGARAESAIAEANILRLDAEQLRRLITTLYAEQQRRLGARQVNLQIRGLKPGTRVRLDGLNFGTVQSDGRLDAAASVGSHSLEFEVDGNRASLPIILSAGQPQEVTGKDLKWTSMNPPPGPTTSTPDLAVPVVAQNRKDFSVSARKYTYEVSGVGGNEGPENRVQLGPEIRVQLGDMVTVTFSADDIAHSFTIGEHYRIDRRAVPGKPVTIRFKADKEGAFEIRCTLTIDDQCVREMKGRLVVDRNGAGDARDDPPGR